MNTANIYFTKISGLIDPKPGGEETVVNEEEQNETVNQEEENVIGNE